MFILRIYTCDKTIELGHPECVRIYTEQMLELHRGQGKELHWREAGSCPTEKEYRLMVVQKTGGLFTLAIRLMHLFRQDDEKRGQVWKNNGGVVPNERKKVEEGIQEYIGLANLLGEYFQIRDDYANLCLEEYTSNKTFAEDLAEGKFNYPIVHAIRNGSYTQSLINNICCH